MDRPTTLYGRHRFVIVFILSTMSSPIVATPLTDSEYHRLSAAVLAGIEATVDRWLDDDVIDIDTHRTGGLLELEFPGGSKIVINTQPPLHELWLAARNGGYHFKHVEGRWLDTRDGRDFFDVLSGCASEQAGKGLRFSA
jgi:CyaY protein